MIHEPWFEKYIPERNSGCWIWLGVVHKDGYGSVYLGKVDGKIKMGVAHRMMYERHVGPIPPDMKALHRCDNRTCCNPDHIFIGTQAENMADKVKKGRCQNQNGERGPGVKLTRQQVHEIRSSIERQNVLAERYGVTQSQISRIKTGDRGMWG